jgi:hypothetical protein
MKILMKLDVNYGPGYRRGKRVTYFNSKKGVSNNLDESSIEDKDQNNKNTKEQEVEDSGDSLFSPPLPPFEAPDLAMGCVSSSSTTLGSPLSSESSGMSGLVVIGDIHGSLTSLKSALEVCLLFCC